MLTAHQITKSYAVPVLQGIDLQINDGEFVVIMGPSGGGKSTLLHILSGMERPDSGTVTLEGQEITALPEKELAQVRLTQLGFVFQQSHLVQSLNLLDNVALPGLMAKQQSRADVEARARELLELTGTAEIADHYPTQASGGQLQRIGIARALINAPKIVFGDEPTGSLNRATTTQVLDLFGEVHRAGTTLVVVTHDPLVAAQADRVVMLVDGLVRDDLSLDTYSGDDDGARLNQVSELMHAHGI